MSTKQNAETAKEFLAALGKFDAARLGLLMTDDATYWILGKPHLHPSSGRKTKAEYCKIVADPAPFVNPFKESGLKITVLKSIAEGDDVALEAESYGVASNGKIYNNTYVFLFTFRNGKIVGAKEYMDTQHAHETFET
jgi:ketosteroid isomerase-like protein